MSWAEFWAYAGVFTLLVAAGLGFPMPEELPIVGGGVLAGQADHKPLPKRVEVVALVGGFNSQASWPGTIPWVAAHECSPPASRVRVRWWIMLPVCFLGVVLSDALLYGVGRAFGSRILRHRWAARLLPAEKRERIERNFHKYGVGVLLFARVLPGIRAPIFITAGIMRFPLRRFILADALYAIPGVSLLFFLSYWFTTSFQELVMWAEEEVLKYRPLLVLIGIVAVVGYLLYHTFRDPTPTGEPEDFPVVGPAVASQFQPQVIPGPNLDDPTALEESPQSTEEPPSQEAS